MIVKLIAANTASRGTVRLERTACTRRMASDQVGTVAKPMPAEISGLR